MKSIRDVILGWFGLKPWQWGRSKEYQENQKESYKGAFGRKKKGGKEGKA